MIILSQTLGEIVGTEQEIVVDIIIDTPLDLPAQNALSPYKIVCPSTARCVSGERYMMRSNGSWVQQPDTHLALDLTGYYTSAETDSAISSALSTYYNQSQVDTLLANRYSLAVVTGSGIPNGTDLDTWTQIGRFQNSNANNGCTNTPESRTNPFWLINERTYTTGRVKQTYYMGQQSNFHIFYWRVQYNSNLDWSQWAKFEGVLV